jgi:DNA polymerase I
MGDHSSRPLLVVDGDSFAHRAYHGLPKSIRRRGNRGAGAIVGFANFLLRLYETERPRAVLVAWDTLDVPTYRHRAFAGYQSGRQFDPELLDQLDVLPNFVAASGFVFAKSPGYEADDFLAAAVADEERRGGTAIVATGDRDAFQLASQLTTILQPVRAGEMARIGPKEVRERYGVAPEQVPDFIALRGDPSDKLPGAPGVGPKGAAALLRKYGTLENLLAQGRFRVQADELRLYRWIATMDKSAPLPFLQDQTPTWAKASALAQKWELNRLAERLDALAHPKPG